MQLELEEKNIIQDFFELKLKRSNQLNMNLLSHFIKNTLSVDVNSNVELIDAIFYNNTLAVINNETKERVKSLIVIDSSSNNYYYINDIQQARAVEKIYV